MSGTKGTQPSCLEGPVLDSFAKFPQTGPRWAWIIVVCKICQKEWNKTRNFYHATKFEHLKVCGQNCGDGCSRPLNRLLIMIRSSAQGFERKFNWKKTGDEPNLFPKRGGDRVGLYFLGGNYPELRGFTVTTHFFSRAFLDVPFQTWSTLWQNTPVGPLPFQLIKGTRRIKWV